MKPEKSPFYNKNFNDSPKKSNKDNIYRMTIIFIITLSFAFIELLVAFSANSLALFADVTHMLSDAASIFIALLAAKVSQKPASNRFSFGFGRSDAIGAFVNAIFMTVIIFFICYEAIDRILNPEPIKGFLVFTVASIGLIINIICFNILKADNSLNSKAASLHIVGDMLGSVAAILSGVIIYFTNYYTVDAILSILVSLILLYPSVILIKSTVIVLMNGVPEDIDYITVGTEIEKMSNVDSIYNLHIWTIGSVDKYLSVHVRVKSLESWSEDLSYIQKMLSNKYQIYHTTIQPILVGESNRD